MRFLLLGDVHADWSFFKAVITSTRDRKIDFDAVIQVGDFGIYPDYVKPLYKIGDELNVPIHFIDGNHEHHEHLWNVWPKMAQHNIFYHPRGTVTVLPDGTKIGWLGGALNVDRQQYYSAKHQSANYPLADEIDLAANAINDCGGVDLMVTHSCPHNIGVGMRGSNFFRHTIKEHIIDALGFPDVGLHDVGDEPLRQFWDKLNHKPKSWIYGHFHKRQHSVVGTTNFYCIGTCDYAYNDKHNDKFVIFIYDTELKKVLY